LDNLTENAFWRNQIFFVAAVVNEYGCRPCPHFSPCSVIVLIIFKFPILIQPSPSFRIMEEFVEITASIRYWTDYLREKIEEAMIAAYRYRKTSITVTLKPFPEVFFRAIARVPLIVMPGRRLVVPIHDVRHYDVFFGEHWESASMCLTPGEVDGVLDISDNSAQLIYNGKDTITFKCNLTCYNSRGRFQWGK
jgi:hypothetical protein